MQDAWPAVWGVCTLHFCRAGGIPQCIQLVPLHTALIVITDDSDKTSSYFPPGHDNCPVERLATCRCVLDTLVFAWLHARVLSASLRVCYQVL